MVSSSIAAQSIFVDTFWNFEILLTSLTDNEVELPFSCNNLRIKDHPLAFSSEWASDKKFKGPMQPFLSQYQIISGIIN